MPKLFLNHQPKSITHLKKGTRGVYGYCRTLKHGKSKFEKVMSAMYMDTDSRSIVVALDKLKQLTNSSINWSSLQKEMITLNNCLIDYLYYLGNVKKDKFNGKALSSKCAKVSKANTKLFRAAAELKRIDKYAYKVVIDSTEFTTINLIMIGLFGNLSKNLY